MKTCPLSADLASCRKPAEYDASGSHWSVHLTPDKLPEAVASLDSQGFFLEDVLGLEAKEGIEVVYHFDRFAKSSRVTLRVMLDRASPSLPSIAAVYPGAQWHERETTDFFGVTFQGNPNPAPLLLDDAYDGPPPLLKDEKSLASIYALFPNYDVADCRPDFLKEDGADAEDGAPTTEDA